MRSTHLQRRESRTDGIWDCSCVDPSRSRIKTGARRWTVEEVADAIRCFCRFRWDRWRRRKMEREVICLLESVCGPWSIPFPSVSGSSCDSCEDCAASRASILSRREQESTSGDLEVHSVPSLPPSRSVANPRASYLTHNCSLAYPPQRCTTIHKQTPLSFIQFSKPRFQPPYAALALFAAPCPSSPSSSPVFNNPLKLRS